MPMNTIEVYFFKCAYSKQTCQSTWIFGIINKVYRMKRLSFGVAFPELYCKPLVRFSKSPSIVSSFFSLAFNALFKNISLPNFAGISTFWAVNTWKCSFSLKAQKTVHYLWHNLNIQKAVWLQTTIWGLGRQKAASMDANTKAPWRYGSVHRTKTPHCLLLCVALPPC